MRSRSSVTSIGRGVTPAIPLIACAAILLLFGLCAPTASAQETPGDAPQGLRNSNELPRAIGNPQVNQPFTDAMNQLPNLSKRENFSSAMQIIVLLTILSLVPSILVMVTSFTRIIIVLALLRQALGTQMLPPNPVLTGLALFMTFVVMGPTLKRVNDDALQPYLNGVITQQEALSRAETPIREFMISQIRAAGNDGDVFVFYDAAESSSPDTWAEVPTLTLIPAFMLSELKIAFLMGFKIYLPFLVIDMVISSMLISMGMMMLPPVLISLPFKLLLFVLVDGWRLIASSLMGSFIV